MFSGPRCRGGLRATHVFNVALTLQRGRAFDVACHGPGRGHGCLVSRDGQGLFRAISRIRCPHGLARSRISLHVGACHSVDAPLFRGNDPARPNAQLRLFRSDVLADFFDRKEAFRRKSRFGLLLVVGLSSLFDSDVPGMDLGPVRHRVLACADCQTSLFVCGFRCRRCNGRVTDSCGRPRL